MGFVPHPEAVNPGSPDQKSKHASERKYAAAGHRTDWPRGTTSSGSPAWGVPGGSLGQSRTSGVSPKQPAKKRS